MAPIAMRACAINWILCTVLLTGCFRSAASKHIPDSEAAKVSLAAALDAWKSGQPPKPLQAADREVRIEDSFWKRGVKIREYEILGEEQGEGARRFRVRLTTVKPNKTEEVEYYVVGGSPVWVFRDRDYRRPAGM